MNKIKLTTSRLFFASFSLCGLMIIQTQAAPTLSANGKIAFTSDRDGNSEIYLMNADGSGQTRLTNSPFGEDYPTWSPDGRKIAFLRQSGGVFSIDLMNADGTNQTQLTTFTIGNGQPYPFERFGMSWSPDGAKIAFQDATDIFTINIDGTNRINLTDGQYFNYEPSWSPDSSRITFARSIYSHGYYPQVYTMDKNGGNVTRITYCVVYCENRSPDWSPDGGQIAIEDNGEDNSYISLVNPDGSNVQHLPGGLKPKWSPDGTKIVFYETTYSDYISHIWVMNRDGSGLVQLTNIKPNNFHPDWQPLTVINVTNLEELYSAVNNPQNAGMQILIAPGVYMLSVNDPNGAARPNSGRLELQENMSLQGVVGDRNAVVIDAINLPASSYNNAPPIPLTAAIRMGRGTNSIEWLTVRHAVNGAANIETDLLSTGTVNIRIAHIVSSGGQRGIDVRNFGAAMAGRVIQAEIVDNDLFDSLTGLGEGLRFVNNLGANGGIINATISNNRSHNNFIGLLIENNRSNQANITVTSNNDRFFENGNGALVGGGLSAVSTPANGNTVSFTAVGTSIENNNGFNPFDLGGLIIVGGENTSFPNGTSNNTVNVVLRGCRLANNQVVDLYAIGARSNPESIGFPGSNNHVQITLSGISRNPSPIIVRADSIPTTPGDMNSATINWITPFDFDGPNGGGCVGFCLGKADVSVFRPSSGYWYILNSSNNSFRAEAFGTAGDRIVPADYDGDGKTDIAVYRDGTWYLLRSTAGFRAVQFGLANDIPQPADFDGDGRAELAVYRNGTWWTLNLNNNQVNSTQFGNSTDKPVAADYDGDGRADQAVYRNGEWHLNQSSQGYAVVSFGLSTDKPVPADYDADGKTDQAVYRDGTWYILQSTNGFTAFQWGLSTDVPVPADYDGDGKTDAAVYRGGVWYLLLSQQGPTTVQFGVANDKPIPAAYVP